MSNFKCQISNVKERQRVKAAKSQSFCNWKLEIGNWKLLPGFTLPELIVTITIFVILLTLVVINLVAVKQRTSLITSVDTFIGDMRQQQLKAMIGDTEGTGTRTEYGVHFLPAAYVLFRGSTYNASDTSNFTIQLGDNISFVGSYSDIVFSLRSGEMATESASILLQDGTTNSQKTILINKFGVVTSVN